LKLFNIASPEVSAKELILSFKPVKTDENSGSFYATMKKHGKLSSYEKTKEGLLRSFSIIFFIKIWFLTF